jgi:hypothetical protein
MTESMQRILKRRALEGHYPKKPEEIIERLEAAAQGWNQDPTPFGGVAVGRHDESVLPEDTMLWEGQEPVHGGPYEGEGTRWRNGSEQTK